MDGSTLLVITLLAGSAVFLIARARALRIGFYDRVPERGSLGHLKILPVYYAARALLWCVLPATALIVLWAVASEGLIDFFIVRNHPEVFASIGAAEQGLLLGSVRRGAEQIAADLPFNSDLSAISAELLALRAYFSQLVDIAFAVLLFAGAGWGLYQVQPQINARVHVENTLRAFMFACAVIAVMGTLGIIFSILFQSLRFFDAVSPFEFLFGLEWSPQIALREGQVASEGIFGVIPLLAGTLLISAVAMCIAVPVGLMSAIYMAEYAGNKVRTVAKPLMEILAGIPTVVYGVFAALTVAPLLVSLGDRADVIVSPESALAAGLVMGVMIIPLVSSLSNDVINAVPQSLREGGYALGATPSEVVRKVVLPAALPGIAGSMLLAMSRAIGETMIVVMATGLAARLTANPLESVTTITVQIVSLLVGDQEFDNPKTLAAFALGLFLFVITLLLNVVALLMVRRYQERYE